MRGSNAGRIMDPAKLLTGSSARWADPLSITKTAVGDPTGQLRRNAANEATKQDIKNGGPQARAQAAFVAEQRRAAQALAAPSTSKSVLGG